MDLPTCPSCGQSVLDDEPGVCPFCGAAMNGSPDPVTALKRASPSTKQATVNDPSQKSPSSGTQSEDPFGIAVSREVRHVITCVPKRTKSRPLHVVCPMCDTRGYIPRSAAGKQVKCSNSECLVPVFTAPDSDKRKTPGLLNRVSDQAVRQEEQLASPAKKHSPVGLYCLLGTVLLAAGLGLRSYLNRNPNEGRFNQPFKIQVATTADRGKTLSDTADLTPETDELFDGLALASNLAEKMIRSAQMSVNRDKALCRRQTADAFLRLGNEDRAQKELDQLLVVSQQRNLSNDYYRITPLARIYWQAVRQNDQTALDALFRRMQPDSRTIPASGLLAIEATIKWCAVLVQRKEAETARKIIERLKFDDTVRSDLDSLHRSVWTAIAMSAVEAGQSSDSPIASLIWTNPVATAIAVELSLQGQWGTAISWATRWTDSAVQTDLLAEISRQAVRQQASLSVINDIMNAASKTQFGQPRIQAVLAGLSDERLQSAIADLQSAETREVRKMLSLREIMRYRRAELRVERERARMLIELARSAASRKKNTLAAGIITSLFECLSATRPPTGDVRQASLELDRSPESLRTRLQEHLGKPVSAADASDFHNYRRGLDRLAASVEKRRLYLIQLLCGVVEIDGGLCLRHALEQNVPLATELTLDPLCQLIAGEAVLAGGSVPRLADASDILIPRGRRTKAQAEEALAPIWLATVLASRESYDKTLLKSFESTLALPGLRSCLQHRITEAQAIKADLKILNAASAMKNAPCREFSLWAATAWLVRGGLVAEVEEWTDSGRLSATDRTLAMSGIISSLELPTRPIRNKSPSAP